STNPMLVVVAAFLVFAGQHELASERYRQRARYAEPVTVLPADGYGGPGVDAGPPQTRPHGVSGVLWGPPPPAGGVLAGAAGRGAVAGGARFAAGGRRAQGRGGAPRVRRGCRLRARRGVSFSRDR